MKKPNLFLISTLWLVTSSFVNSGFANLPIEDVVKTQKQIYQHSGKTFPGILASSSERNAYSHFSINPFRSYFKLRSIRSAEREKAQSICNERGKTLVSFATEKQAVSHNSIVSNENGYSSRVLDGSNLGEQQVPLRTPFAYTNHSDHGGGPYIELGLSVGIFASMAVFLPLTSVLPLGAAFAALFAMFGGSAVTVAGIDHHYNRNVDYWPNYSESETLKKVEKKGDFANHRIFTELLCQGHSQDMEMTTIPVISTSDVNKSKRIDAHQSNIASSSKSTWQKFKGLFRSQQAQ